MRGFRHVQEPAARIGVLSGKAKPIDRCRPAAKEVVVSVIFVCLHRLAQMCSLPQRDLHLHVERASPAQELPDEISARAATTGQQ